MDMSYGLLRYSENFSTPWALTLLRYGYIIIDIIIIIFVIVINTFIHIIIW